MLFRIVLLTVFLASIGISPLFAQVDSCPTGTSTPNTDEPGFTPECVGRVPYSGVCPPGFNKYPLNGFGYYCYAALTHCPSNYVLGKTKKNPVDGCYHRDDLNAELGREAVTERLADEVVRGNVSTPAAKQLKAIENVFWQQETSFCAHGVADCRRIFLKNLEYRPITLNPLGETGMIITGVPSGCAGACPTPLFVLKKVGQGYEKVLEGGGGQAEPSRTVTNGFYDILLSEPKTKTMYDFLGVPSKQKAAKSVKYIWTGSGYALTPQVRSTTNKHASSVSHSIAEREIFAEELTKKMSSEIVWCAAGANGAVLAGYATTSYLSPKTFSQIETGSPLYMELYQHGFRILGMFDRDQTMKTAALTDHGARTAYLPDFTTQQRADLENATDVLMRVANGVDRAHYRGTVDGREITNCIIPAASDTCGTGEAKEFMPGVGYVCD